jgi:hypothetical protein
MIYGTGIFDAEGTSHNATVSQISENINTKDLIIIKRAPPRTEQSG